MESPPQLFGLKKQAKFRRRRCYNQDKEGGGGKRERSTKVGHVMSAVGGAFFVCVCVGVFVRCASGAVKKVHWVSLPFQPFLPTSHFSLTPHTHMHITIS